MAKVYAILEKDATRYRKILAEYYIYVEGKNDAEAAKLAAEGFDNLINDKDLAGKPWKNSNVVLFDDVLSVVTNNYHTPAPSARVKYKKGGKRPGVKGKKTAYADVATKSSEVDEIKKNLLEAYPSLSRLDLAPSVDNYCQLSLKIQKLLAGDSVANNVAIKNFSDTMTKLGSFLGVDESEKRKAKALDDKQSVAALALTFQQTIEDYPEIVTRMRYKELQILLGKYNRQELSRELFELSSCAECTVEVARAFISKYEGRYEAK